MPAARQPNGTAAIGNGVSIRGDITSREDLFIGGDVQGSLQLEQHRLTIGPGGKIRANIKAREVTIHGSVQGNVETTDKIVIHKDGSLIGDIKTAGIVIEDGAYFKGSIDIIRPAKVAPAPAPAAAPPASPTVATAGTAGTS
jgi:cytoskeletal protein CcmA (bactofilin family)